MGDVDDLLAELDAELASSAKPKSSSISKPGWDHREQENSRPQPSSSSHSKADDIDSLLADLGDMGGPTPVARPKPPPQRPAAAPSTYAASPGSMPFPGSSSGGGGSSGDTASGLRCSKCDFRVLRFRDTVWSADVDYMFFRNFMPNVSKLEAKLTPSDGDCAFACQCTWASAELGMPTGVAHWFMSR